MSDETPTPDAAATPAASTPEPEPAATPVAPPTPEPTPAPAPVAEAPAAAPTQPEIPVAAAAAAPTEPVAPVAPVAPVTPVATAAPASSGHVEVPKWVLVSIAAVIGALVMFGIGYAVGDGSSSDNNTAVATPFGGQAPIGNQNGDGTQQNPFGNGNQNGGGTQQIPQSPQSPQVPSSPNQGGGSTQTPSTGSGAFLGVATQQVSDGLEVTQVVSGSAADDAGIETGDVIVEFDGNPVTTSAQLANAVSNADPGDTVTVTYERNGQSRTVTVELGSRSTSSN